MKYQSYIQEMTNHMTCNPSQDPKQEYNKTPTWGNTLEGTDNWWAWSGWIGFWGSRTPGGDAAGETRNKRKEWPHGTQLLIYTEDVLVKCLNTLMHHFNLLLRIIQWGKQDYSTNFANQKTEAYLRSTINGRIWIVGRLTLQF